MSWTHDVGLPQQRRYRFFPEYAPRFDEVRHGFSREVMERRYPSDGHGGHDFIPLLLGYDLLLERHSSVFDRDLELVQQINNAAHRNRDRRELALKGQYEDQALTVSDGLGATIGPIYLEAMLDGRLPRTYQLLSKYRPNGRVAHEGASCNPAKAHWHRVSARPYIKAAAQIDHHDLDGGDAHAGQDGSFPSGHTSEAYWQGLTLATLLPELASGILARTADAGHSRIVMGAHYPLDVIGGRIMGTYIVANRWSDDQFRPLLHAAREELVRTLEELGGSTLDRLVAAEEPYMEADEAAAWYAECLTYGFDQVGESGRALSVPPEAPDLLLTAHPGLDRAQRSEVLRLTAIDSGYPLDIEGRYGGWQRLNLLAAMTAKVVVDNRGGVSLATS